LLARRNTKAYLKNRMNVAETRKRAGCAPELSVRRQLVRQRTGLINQARGLLRGWGVMLPARFFQARGGWKDLQAKRLPEYLRPLLETMKGVYEQLTRAIRQVETTLKQREHNDERVARLETIPGVGRVSALTLVAAVDKIARFGRAKQLTAYNGIVPTVRSSGEREQQGSITRQGRSEVRAVWIQAAHSLVRSRQPAARALQTWFWKVARRRGVRTAIVALAKEDVEFGVLSLTGWNAVRTAATATGSCLKQHHSGNRGDRQRVYEEMKG
jgi:transposase